MASLFYRNPMRTCQKEMLKAEGPIKKVAPGSRSMCNAMFGFYIHLIKIKIIFRFKRSRMIIPYMLEVVMHKIIWLFSQLDSLHSHHHRLEKARLFVQNQLML